MKDLNQLKLIFIICKENEFINVKLGEKIIKINSNNSLFIIEYNWFRISSNWFNIILNLKKKIHLNWNKLK